MTRQRVDESKSKKKERENEKSESKRDKKSEKTLCAGFPLTNSFG